MAAIALLYHLRAPEWAATQPPALYRECLAQCAWADERGAADIVVLSEHHAMDDGFLPAPLTMAGAIAGRTKNLRVMVAAALVPLHDPVRFAEQMVVLDHASGGRVGFVAGAGYTHHEFEMAGVDRSRRGKLVEEHVRVMLRAWTGEPFEWQGRTIRVTPKPFTQPHPLILMGGASTAAARRAARLKLPFFPSNDNPEVIAAYEEECQKVGHEGFSMVPNGPTFVHVTEDPDKAWAELSRYIWYDADTYRSWQTDHDHSSVTTEARDLDELKKEGLYRIVTPDECLALADELGPTGNIVLNPLLAGMSAELGWASLELFHAKVLPRLRPSS